MTKIKVTPEGRPDAWIVSDRDSLKAWIEEQSFGQIHSIGFVGPVHLGCDTEVQSVLASIDSALRVALLTGDGAAMNLNHALALVMDDGNDTERLEVYDIGNVSEENFEIVDETVEVPRALIGEMLDWCEGHYGPRAYWLDTSVPARLATYVERSQ